jgi:hypothetical protein
MTDTFLKQWAGADAPAAQGPAKQHEFSVYIPPLMATLNAVGAKTIVDFQADEGVVSAAFCAQVPENRSTFVLVAPQDDPGDTMRRMAENITDDMRKGGQVTLAASLSDVAHASADAILFNNILGCQGGLENVEAIIAAAPDVLKPHGYAVVTVPNPDGGNFSSYSCMNLPAGGAHGGTYDFQMRGEKDVFRNLYLTEQGLRDVFARHGFAHRETVEIADKPYEGVQAAVPAFRQYLFQRLG